MIEVCVCVCGGESLPAFYLLVLFAYFTVLSFGVLKRNKNTCFFCLFAAQQFNFIIKIDFIDVDFVAYTHTNELPHS